MVAIRESINSVKEIKRLVGFPGERIRIDEGDIWVNDSRLQKSLALALRQSVLVEAWERSVHNHEPRFGAWTCNDETFQGALPNASIVRFAYRNGGFIDNRLASNAHDSHQIVPVNDVGIAIEWGPELGAGELECVLRTPQTECKASVLWEVGGIRICTDRHSKMLSVKDVSLSRNETGGHWLIVCHVDGNLIVGDADQEWHRELCLPTPRLTNVGGSQEGDREKSKQEPPQSPVELRWRGESRTVRSLLVFRDLHYRGAHDAPEQTWEPANGIVVLGDNISTSTDSRDRWPGRLRMNAVKGVVVESQNPVEELLKQRLRASESSESSR
jgi:hypothetical protein